MPTAKLRLRGVRTLLASHHFLMAALKLVYRYTDPLLLGIDQRYSPAVFEPPGYSSLLIPELFTDRYYHTFHATLRVGGIRTRVRNMRSAGCPMYKASPETVRRTKCTGVLPVGGRSRAECLQFVRFPECHLSSLLTSGITRVYKNHLFLFLFLPFYRQADLLQSDTKISTQAL